MLDNVGQRSVFALSARRRCRSLLYRSSNKRLSSVHYKQQVDESELEGRKKGTFLFFTHGDEIFILRRVRACVDMNTIPLEQCGADRRASVIPHSSWSAFRRPEPLHAALGGAASLMFVPSLKLALRYVCIVTPSPFASLPFPSLSFSSSVRLAPARPVYAARGHPRQRQRGCWA